MSSSATLTAQSDYAFSTYANYTGASFAATVSDSSDASYAYGTDNFETVDSWYFECEFTDMPAALGVESVVVTVRAKNGSGVSGTNYVAGRLRVNGVSYDGSATATTGSSASYTWTWTTNPNTGVAWTPAGVNAIRAGASYYVSGYASPGARIAPEVSEVTVTVYYSPTPTAVEVSRYLASYELWLRKRPEAFLASAGNFDLLNLSMLGLVDMEHTAGPHETDIGWEDEVWQRRPFAVHGIDIDPIGMGTTLRLKDQRAARCLVRDLAWSDKASGTLRDGISRFSTPGSVFTFTRASEHTFTNPVGESETVPTDCEAYGDGGLYMLSAAGSVAAPRYYVTNNSGERSLNAAQGTFFCQVKLAAVSAVANQTVAYCYHDASNWWWLYWDPVTATDRWVFEIRAGGSTYRAIKETTPSSATWYQIGARWTGSNTENGVSAYTLSIFIDGVKGTDAVAGAAMTEVASSNFDFGSKAAAGTDQLNGQIRKIHSLQYVMTDTEMQRAI